MKGDGRQEVLGHGVWREQRGCLVEKETWYEECYIQLSSMGGKKERAIKS